MKKKLAIVAVIVGMLLFAVGYGYKHRYAASIGIIGGADGPTAIFIAGQTRLLFYAGLLILALAGLAILVRIWRRRK